MNSRAERNAATALAPAWWERDDLCARGTTLTFDGCDPEQIAPAERKPVFFYERARVHANLTRLTDALGASGVRARVFYAMRSNLHAAADVSAYARPLRDDACSPEELLLARRTGFAEGDISYTSTVPSDADLEVFARHPHVCVNCDSLAAIERFATRCSPR